MANDSLKSLTLFSVAISFWLVARILGSAFLPGYGSLTAGALIVGLFLGVLDRDKGLALVGLNILITVPSLPGMFTWFQAFMGSFSSLFPSGINALEINFMLAYMLAWPLVLDPFIVKWILARSGFYERVKFCLV